MVDLSILPSKKSCFSYLNLCGPTNLMPSVYLFLIEDEPSIGFRAC